MPKLAQGKNLAGVYTIFFFFFLPARKKNPSAYHLAPCNCTHTYKNPANDKSLFPAVAHLVPLLGKNRQIEETTAKQNLLGVGGAGVAYTVKERSVE